MGMISEIEAARTAEHLEKILMDALTSGNDTIREFARKNLYKWYVDECGDSWGLHDPNPEIENVFKNGKESVDLDSHAFGGINKIE
jgi:hypothetical protein